RTDLQWPDDSICGKVHIHAGTAVIKLDAHVGSLLFPPSPSGRGGISCVGAEQTLSYCYIIQKGNSMASAASTSPTELEVASPEVKRYQYQKITIAFVS